MNARRTSVELARQLCLVRRKKIKKLKDRIDSGQYEVKNVDVAISLFMSK